MADARIHKHWFHWGGSREDLQRIADAASESITRKVGVPTSVSLTVEHKDGLIETGGMEKLARLHDTELREIEEIDLTVAPDQAAWNEKHNTGYKTPPDEKVHLILGRGGAHLWVYGSDRDQVRGLTGTLAKEVGRGGGTYWHSFAFAACAEALGVGASFGVQAAFGRLKGTVGLLVLIAELSFILVGAGLGYFWLFPRMEVRPDGTPSRWSRTRTVTLTAAGTLALGVVATFVASAVHASH